MMRSKNPQGERRFITDFGEQLPLTDESGKQVMLLPRYGVWGDLGRGKPEVIETHNDLAMMQAEHGVPNERVVLLKRRQQSQTTTEHKARLDQINRLEPAMEKLTDEELQQKTEEFKARLKANKMASGNNG